jgi:hypothetical protein
MQTAKTRVSIFMLVSLCVFSVQAQISNPPDWFPLVSDSKWFYDNDTDLTQSGTKKVNGRTGILLKFEDDSSVVLRDNNNTLEILQITFTETDLCNKLAISPDDPIPWITPGISPGNRRNVSGGVSVNCDGDKFDGTMSGTIEYVRLSSTYTVPLGTFFNVAEMEMDITFEAKGESIRLLYAFWLVENVGPIRIRDYSLSEAADLTGGRVGGVDITPSPPAPPAPESVSATDGVYTDKVLISWNPSPGADGYKIYRAGDNDSASAELLATNPSSAYEDTTATPGTIYFYWIKAVGGGQESSFSSSDSGYRRAAPIEGPGGLQVSQISRAGYIADHLYAGNLVYGDRSYTFQNPLPPNYEGHIYIRTLNDDKDATGDGFFSFAANKACSVIVAHDSRYNRPPSWMSGWVERSDRLWTDVGDRRLYAKQFAPGTITLGANRDPAMDTGYSMYSVVVMIEQSSAKCWVLYR